MNRAHRQRCGSNLAAQPTSVSDNLNSVVEIYDTCCAHDCLLRQLQKVELRQATAEPNPTILHSDIKSSELLVTRLLKAGAN